MRGKQGEREREEREEKTNMFARSPAALITAAAPAALTPHQLHHTILLPLSLSLSAFTTATATTTTALCYVPLLLLLSLSATVLLALLCKAVCCCRVSGIDAGSWCILAAALPQSVLSLSFPLPACFPMLLLFHWFTSNSLFSSSLLAIHGLVLRKCCCSCSLCSLWCRLRSTEEMSAVRRSERKTRQRRAAAAVKVGRKGETVTAILWK